MGKKVIKLGRKFTITKRKPTVKQIAEKALRIAKEVKGNDEIKYYDIPVVTANPSTTSTGVIALTKGTAQGTGAQGRTGEEISPLSLQFRYKLQPNSAATSTHYVRIVVFQWKTEGDPLYDDYLDVGGTPTISTELPTYLKAFANRDRCKTLYDHTHVLDYGTSKMDGIVVNKFFDLSGKIKWDGADSLKNNVYMFALSTLTTNLPTFMYATRLTFRG